MFGIGTFESAILIHVGSDPEQSGSLGGKWLDSDISRAQAVMLAKRFAQRSLGRRRLEMTPQKLLYRSTRVPSGGTGAALNLTPRALGWRYIHFAVRHLACGVVWSGHTGREERCLVLLQGRFDVRWGGRSYRVGPRDDVFSGYPHAVYLPAGTPFHIVAGH